MIGDFYIFDCVLLFILLIAAIAGYARGMTQQLLSIGGWVTAIIVTLHARESVTAIGRRYIENPTLADIVSLAVVFVLLLLVLISISTLIGRTIKRSMIGGLDRSLGILTGMGIFYFAISAFYIAVSFVVPPHQIPHEISHSRSFGLIQSGARSILSILPKNFVEAIPQAVRLPDNLLPGHSDSMAHVLSQMKPATPEKEKTSTDGYSNTERKDLDALFETVGEK